MRTMNLQTLNATLNELCEAQPFETSWYLRDVHSGSEIDRRGDVVVPSASIRKIAILMAALEAVHDGELALDQPVTIQAKYQNTTSGCFQHLQPGFTIQLQDALVMMIIVSDNTSTGTVVDMIGLERINEYSRALGMKGTTHRYGIPPHNLPREHDVTYSNETTPSDVGLLLNLILQGTRETGAASKLGSTPDLCRLAVDILSWQKLNSRMPSFLPAGTKVAHKTGTSARGYSDAGIVFVGDEPRFIFAVYTDYVSLGTAESLPGITAASQHIGRLTCECWDALAG